jgi:hypothetical protein
MEVLHALMIIAFNDFSSVSRLGPRLSKTSIVIAGSLRDSSAFSLFRISDLFRISSFGFRISLPVPSEASASVIVPGTWKPRISVTAAPLTLCTSQA